MRKKKTGNFSLENISLRLPQRFEGLILPGCHYLHAGVKVDSGETEGSPDND